MLLLLCFLGSIADDTLEPGPPGPQISDADVSSFLFPQECHPIPELARPNAVLLEAFHLFRHHWRSPTSIAYQQNIAC